MSARVAKGPGLTLHNVSGLLEHGIQLCVVKHRLAPLHPQFAIIGGLDVDLRHDRGRWSSILFY